MTAETNVARTADANAPHDDAKSVSYTHNDTVSNNTPAPHTATTPTTTAAAAAAARASADRVTAHNDEQRAPPPPSQQQQQQEGGEVRPVSVLGIVRMSLPLGLAAVAQFSANPVLIAMVGRYVGTEQLGGTTLAFGLINATAFACASGFCGALETLLSHSYGRNPNSKLYGTYAQRMTLLLLVIALVLGPVLVFADVVLRALRQNPAVTLYTGQFCLTGLFGIFPAMLLELVRRYFACQHLNGPLMCNLLAGAAVYPLVVWVCIQLFGYRGAPVAWSLLMFAMTGSLIAYLWRTGKYTRTWGGWDMNALRNFRTLLRLALPSMGMMLSEWVAFEINAITAGYAPPASLAAFGITYQVSGIVWSLASGVYISAAVLVGNALGQGRNQLARHYAFVCLGVAAMIACIDVAVIYVARDFVCSLFSGDPAVAEAYKSVLPYFLCYHLLDAQQSTIMGIFRGCGKQFIGAVAIAFVLSIVGVPFGILLFATTSLSVRALWLGPTLSMLVVGTPIYVYSLLYYIKWDTLSIHDAETVPVVLSSSDEDEVTAAAVAATAAAATMTTTAAARGGGDAAVVATRGGGASGDGDGGDVSCCDGVEYEMHGVRAGHRSATTPHAASSLHGSLSDAGGAEGLDNLSFASHTSAVALPNRTVLTTGGVATLAPSPPPIAVQRDERGGAL